MTNTFFISYM